MQPRAVQDGTDAPRSPPSPLPCLSHRRALYSSPSSPLSPSSTTVDATTAASTPPSSFSPRPLLSSSPRRQSPAFSSLFFVFAATVTSPPSPPFPLLPSPAIHHCDPPPLHLPSPVLAAAAVHRHRLCSLLFVTAVDRKRHRALLTFFPIRCCDPDAITLLSGSSTNRIPPTAFLLSPRTPPPPFASLHSVPHRRPPPPSSPNTVSITHLPDVSLLRRPSPPHRCLAFPLLPLLSPSLLLRPFGHRSHPSTGSSAVTRIRRLSLFSFFRSSNAPDLAVDLPFFLNLPLCCSLFPPLSAVGHLLPPLPAVAAMLFPRC